jgi:hypothetical protein
MAPAGLFRLRDGILYLVVICHSKISEISLKLRTSDDLGLSGFRYEAVLIKNYRGIPLQILHILPYHDANILTAWKCELKTAATNAFDGFF